MKKFSLKEMLQLENMDIIRKQKVTLLKIILWMLLSFSALMLMINLRQGNQRTYIGILVLMAIFLLELGTVHFIHNAAYVFAIGKCLVLTTFFCYRLTGCDTGGNTIWFWFLAAPPFAVYISGFFWGFWVIAYGQILLILLLWTPLSDQVITPMTEYLTKLPCIYFIVGTACLAMCYSLTCYQLEQQHANRVYKNQLSEFKERRRVDRLTGLLNRDFAEEQISTVMSAGKPGAFFLMDLDNLKLINDLKGHQYGDQVIASFAESLRKVFKEKAILVRLGGDEFIACVPDCKEVGELQQMAENVLEYADHLVDEPSLTDKIGVSIGIALAPEDGMTFQELYTNADKAQYFSKRNGKKRYSFYKHNYKHIQKDTGANLKTLHRMVQDVHQKKGAYCVEYGSFNKVYQFVERNVGRQPKDSQILLFTIQEGADTPVTENDMETAIKQLQEAVRFSLRVGDLMMVFSRTQIAVLLVNCDQENTTMVVERILNTYRNAGNGPEVTVEYEMDSIQNLNQNVN